MLVILINSLCQASWANPYQKSAAALQSAALGPQASPYQSTASLPAQPQQPVLIQGGWCQVTRGKHSIV